MAVYAVEYVYDPRDDERAALRPDHRAFLGRLLEAGVVLASGPLDGGTGALILVHAPSEQDARDALAVDPFAVAGLIASTTIRPWLPVIGPWADLAS